MGGRSVHDKDSLRTQLLNSPTGAITLRGPRGTQRNPGDPREPQGTPGTPWGPRGIPEGGALGGPRFRPGNCPYLDFVMN